MPQIGPLEIAVVLVVALVVFGPNRLPELARQVGGALRELRRFQQHIRDEMRDIVEDESHGAAPPPTLPPKAEAPSDEPPAGETATPGAPTAGAPGTEGPGGVGEGLPPTDVPTSGTSGDVAPPSEPD